MAGMLTFFVGNFFDRGQADLQPFFTFHPWLYVVLIPALSMRLWAEERRSGTIELFLTLPIRMTEAVLGKFLAAWCFAGIALIADLPVLDDRQLSRPPGQRRDPRQLLASWLMAGALLAVGACISAMTKNQVIAFVVTAALGFCAHRRGLPDRARGVPGLGAGMADPRVCAGSASSAISARLPAASSMCATSSISCRS